MRPFEFATAGRIVFGAGTFAQLESIAATYGRKPFTVRGKRGDGFRVTGEPAIDLIRDGVQAFRDDNCDMVIAIGGGSVIDAGKAIAALAANPGDILEYLEVIGKGRPLDATPYPFVAVPTTAGTGSEVTRNAVLGSKEQRVKVSLRSPLMLARVAIIDPNLTLSMPREITAGTGLDALTQLVEPYVSTRANPMTDNFCLDGMRHVRANLRRAYTHGNDEARSGMCWASLLGGLALANAGLGVVHGFAAPIGGMFDVPHGACCAALLAAGIHGNIRALRERDAQGPALERYRTLARLLTGDDDAIPEDGARWVEQLVNDLSIPPLASYGISSRDLPELVGKASRASSMKANPIALTPAELTAVIESSL